MPMITIGVKAIIMDSPRMQIADAAVVTESVTVTGIDDYFLTR